MSEIDPNDLSLIYRDFNYPLDIAGNFSRYDIDVEWDDETKRVGANQYAWKQYDSLIQYEWLKRSTIANRMLATIKFADVSYVQDAFNWHYTYDSYNYWNDVYRGRIDWSEDIQQKIQKMYDDLQAYSRGTFEPFTMR